QSNHERDELWEAKIEKTSSTLFTTETRSTRMHGEPVELRIADCGLRIADFLPLHLHHKDTKMTKRHHVESSWLRVLVVRFFWLRLGCSVLICVWFILLVAAMGRQGIPGQFSLQAALCPSRLKPELRTCGRSI